MTHLCAAKMHFMPDRSTKWLYVQRRFVPLALNFCSTVSDVFVFLSAPPSSAVLTDAKGVEVFFYLLSENEIFLQVQVVCGGW
jgi:hypothetical protein